MPRISNVSFEKIIDGGTQTEIFEPSASSTCGKVLDFRRPILRVSAPPW